jgi:prevent-host-death family protein
MLDITKDRQSLTAFRRRSGDFMRQLKKTKRPVVLTVKGKAQAVVQDVDAYQRLLDIAANADAREGIRQGLEDSKQGLGRHHLRRRRTLRRTRPGVFRRVPGEAWHTSLALCLAPSATSRQSTWLSTPNTQTPRFDGSTVWSTPSSLSRK